MFRIQNKFKSLETSLSYKFRNKLLLENALTHRSRAHEDVSGGVVDNESLEFLGDSILGMIISDQLFREYPDYDEGQKSKIKSVLVSSASLSKLGKELGLGEYLFLGRGEEKTGGREKPSLIADTFEAIVAAIYLDGGLKAAEGFIKQQFSSVFNDLQRGSRSVELTADYKSALQEWLQAHNKPLPNYILTKEWGPDHKKSFEVEVNVGTEKIARAEGRSKKEAEQKVARTALDILEEQD